MHLHLGNPIRTPHLLHSLAWVCIDGFLIIVAFLLALSARMLLDPFVLVDGIGFIFAATAILIGNLFLNGVYRRIWSQTSGRGIVVIVRALLFSGIIIIGLLFLLRPRPLPLSVAFVGCLLTFGALVTTRYRSRLIGGLSWRWQVVWGGKLPQDQRIHVLIVGTGELAQSAAQRFQQTTSRNQYRILGLIDEDPQKKNLLVENYPILGTAADIPRLAGEFEIELIVIALPSVQGTEFRRILTFCEATEARLQVVQDMLDGLSSSTNLPTIRDIQPEDLIGRSPITRHAGIDTHLIADKTVLVTGAAGSIGSELCRQLLDYAPQQLILLDNNESGLHDLQLELRARQPKVEVQVALVDITHADAVEAIYCQHRPQIVFHVAAYKHVPMLEFYPAEALRVNIGGTLQVARLAIAYQVERFVLVSTDKAVDPSSVMGASKRVCELIIHALAQQPPRRTLFTAVRFGNVLGSRGSVVPIFTQQIDHGGPVTVTHPEMTRYFMSIPEAANLVIHAACMTKGNEIFVLRMGEVVRILDIAERMIRLRGLRPYVDIPIQFTGIRNGEKMHESLNESEELVENTAHPYIMKLNYWTPAKNNVFLEQVEQLLTQGFRTKKPLEELRALCYGDKLLDRLPTTIKQDA